jgi:hypothetical protein
MRSLRCIGSFGRTNDLTSFKKWVNLRFLEEGLTRRKGDSEADVPITHAYRSALARCGVDLIQIESAR